MIYFTFTPIIQGNDQIIPSNILENFHYEGGSYYAKSNAENLRQFDLFYPSQISEEEYNYHAKYLPTGSI